MTFAYDDRLRTDMSHALPIRPVKGYAIKGGRVVLRDPTKIIGITLHQTACEFGLAAYQIKAARGDRRLAQARRALAVPAHVVSFEEQFVTPCPLLALAYHGHGLNNFTYGEEIEGLYFGVAGDLKTLWTGKLDRATEWTPKRRDTARAALYYIYTNGRRLGSPLEYLFAHRQSTAKPSDPGQQVWEDIAIDFGEKELGLKPKLEYTLVDRHGRKGRPIPREWDPRSPVKY
jgi:hypothetical protein